MAENTGKANSPYASSDWMATLGKFGPSQAVGYEGLSRALLADGALPAKIKHFIVFLIHTTNGQEELARLHAAEANRLGARPEEWHEVLLAGLLARGPRAYSVGARLLDLHRVAPQGVDPSEASEAESVESILVYFEQRFGNRPFWLTLMAERLPDMLRGYYAVRREVMRDAVLPQKYKDYLIVGLNAADRFEPGMEVHAQNAMRAGGTPEELLEAMACGVLGNGLPAWLASEPVFSRIIGRKAER